jgi:hydrogenase maturation protein HypF
MKGESIRVTGLVQGVGFRPTVWRLASQCGLAGSVRNDAQGVLIEAWGSGPSIDEFVRRLSSEPPPLARIEAIIRYPLVGEDGGATESFQIIASHPGASHTGVAADAATCPDCLCEVMNPGDRRFRYAFTNCTHCGPRLSIIESIPYDRAETSMAAFHMCDRCQHEYDDPTDRRFHAQPNACSDCGPRVWLEDTHAKRVRAEDCSDAIALAARLLRGGQIVAIKGVGGFHLACDAQSEAAVERLRRRKLRYRKAFALMAKDVDMVGRYASVSEVERSLLTSRAAPIVILEAAGQALPAGIAPGQHTLGFVLPYTPLHHLLMREVDGPLVMTSGNRSDEPQVTDNDAARRHLESIADYFLLHDRGIVNRLDDSIVKVMDDKPRLLRRARGYVPQPIQLSPDFADTGEILAMGGQLKNTFCLLKDGQAVLSPHIGDLEDVVTLRDYRRILGLFSRLYDHDPVCIAVDDHPRYHSAREGKEWARRANIPLVGVQHHHAHVAACMAEHGLGLTSPPVLGIVLDGLGFGADGSLWGGEFLLADYAGFRRLGHFQPVRMLGASQAVREPWRNTLAHLLRAFGWDETLRRFEDLEIVRFLQSKPLDGLRAMAETGLNSPLASSSGRLFDAAAAAIGVCRETVFHEGQAAVELESLAAPVFHQQAQNAYPFDVVENACKVLVWRRMWQQLLEDARDGVSPPVLAARFHQAVVQAVVYLAEALCRDYRLDTVVIGGGVFQNRLLLEGVSVALRRGGLRVLAPQRVPANDGGLALGQLVVAAARRTGSGTNLPDIHPGRRASVS